MEIKVKNKKLDKTYTPEISIVATGGHIDGVMSCEILMHSERTSNIYLATLVLDICKSLMVRMSEGSTLEDVFFILRQLDNPEFFSIANKDEDFMKSIEDIRPPLTALKLVRS